MVWNTGARGSNVSERATNVSSYPTYNMEYLSNALGAGRSGTKYNVPENLVGMDALVYTQKATTGFRREAKQALHNEFSLWLQRQHNDNNEMAEYDNSRKGVVERRHFMDGKVGAKDKWKPTWWGKLQLTHLPGVRQYLIDSKISAERETMDLNQLAEFGPQNLEDAWAYFKTWVKGMPISEAVNFNHAPTLDFDRSNFGPKMPSEMMRNDPLLDTKPTENGTQWRYQGPESNSETPVTTEPNSQTEQSFQIPMDANSSFLDSAGADFFDATYTQKPTANGTNYVDDNPVFQGRERMKEDQYYDRTRTTRNSQYVEGGKARHVTGEFLRGVRSDVEDREHRDRPPSPGSSVRPSSRKYTAQNRPPSNQEDMSEYVEFVGRTGFNPGNSVPPDYEFTAPPAQPTPPIVENMDAEPNFYGINPNPVPPIYGSGSTFDNERQTPTNLRRNVPMFNPGDEAVNVALDPLRGLEKRQVEGRGVLQPHRLMASDRQANPPFVWMSLFSKNGGLATFVPNANAPV